MDADTSYPPAKRRRVTPSDVGHDASWYNQLKAAAAGISEGEEKSTNSPDEVGIAARSLKTEPATYLKLRRCI